MSHWGGSCKHDKCCQLNLSHSVMKLTFSLVFFRGWYSLVPVVGSEVDEVTEPLFGHGGDSSGGCTVVRLTCISNLEHHFAYKSSQSSKYLV